MSKRLTTEEFIQKAKLVHGEKYDYSESKYKTNKYKIIINCFTHGKFEQTPVNHLYNKQACPICANKILIEHNERQKLTNNDFIEKAKAVHGDKYDYSKVCYINKKTKIKIICPEHGEFEQKPEYHLRSCGCPKCNESKGERIISEILNEKGVKYIRNFTFDGCKNVNKLPFDFYLPDYNTCIEYDGEQHFKPIKVFGGEARFKKQQITDKIKTNYCLLNEINLVRIKYDDNIFERLETLIK